MLCDQNLKRLRTYLVSMKDAVKYGRLNREMRLCPVRASSSVRIEIIIGLSLSEGDF